MTTKMEPGLPSDKCDTCVYGRPSTAKYICHDCKQKYCQSCYEHHARFTGTATHRVSSTSVDEGFQSAISSPDENHVYPVPTADTRTNKDHTVATHRTDIHNPITAGQYLSITTRDDIQKAVQEGHALIKQLENRKDENKTKFTDIETEAAGYVHTIDETMRNIRKLVYELETTWNSKIDTIKTDSELKLQGLKKNIDTLESLSDSIQTMINHLYDMFREGSNSQIQIAIEDLVNKIESVTKDSPDLRRASLMAATNGKGQESCGTLKSLSNQLDTLCKLDCCMIAIHSSLPSPAHIPTFTEVETQLTPRMAEATTAEATIPKEVDSRSMEVQPIRQSTGSSECTFKVRLQSDDKTCGITGIAVLPKGKIVMADFINLKLKLLNTLENSITEVKLDREPRDIAVVDDNKVVVTIPMGKIIQFVHVDTCMSLGATLAMPGKCCGIVYHDRKIFVAIQIPTLILVVDSETGEQLITIRDEQRIQRPTYLALSEDHMVIYVSDLQVKCVYGFTMDGRQVFTYPVQHPHGVCLDLAGNLFVADVETNSIHKVIKQGDKGVQMGKLQAPDLISPQKVWYNSSTNRLAVTMWDNDIIKIFSFTKSG